jgi:hypothetical protein
VMDDRAGRGFEDGIALSVPLEQIEPDRWP